jgi:hypothetical protein
MCHKLFKRYLILIFIVVAGHPAIAQFGGVAATQNFQTQSNRENAPYSRFGIGEFRSGLNPALKGMGSISAAYANPYAVNSDNPASYASLMLTTYEGALYGSRRTVASGSDKYPTGMATINNMSVGIPLGKRGGMSFGFTPTTHIYYNLQDTLNTTGYGSSVRTFFGDGSLNYAYIGGAFKYKGLSVGANFGYLFGTTVYASRIESIDGKQNVNDAQFAQIVKAGGIYWKGGLMYETRLNKSLWLRTGGTLTLSQEIKSKHDNYWLNFNTFGGDTVYQRLKTDGTTTMPMMYSFGVHIADSNKWVVGVDFSGANWSNYQSVGRVDSVTDMSYKLGVGGEYTPDAASVRKYFRRVSYRLGFYYGQDYIMLRNTPLNYYAVTFGVGLPFKRYTDKVNAAFEIGNRGTENAGLIKEAFFKCTVGITLNDKWFIKRRYD